MKKDDHKTKKKWLTPKVKSLNFNETNGTGGATIETPGGSGPITS